MQYIKEFIVQLTPRRFFAYRNNEFMEDVRIFMVDGDYDLYGEVDIPDAYSIINGYMVTYAMEILDELNEKVVVNYQPGKIAVWEIFVPLTTVMKLTEIMDETNGRNIALDKVKEILQIIGAIDRKGLLTSKNDLDYALMAISYMAPSVRALRNGYYVKRMSITWKLILAIHNFIAEEYVAYKNELDDKCAYDLMVGTCVDSICEAFSGGKRAPSNVLPVSVVNKCELFVVQTLQTICKLYGKYAIETDFMAIIELFSVIVHQVDYVKERLEHFKHLERIMLDIWADIQRLDDIDELLREAIPNEFGVKLGIDFLRLVLQSGSLKMMVNCVSWFIPDLMLNYIPYQVDIFAENPEYLDELIAWSGAFFLKSSHHRMVYVELEATFTKGMISGSFLLTHYSYNVWVYYLTHQANNVRLQYFDIWIMIREHLEPTAESTAFFYVTQLVYRIFEMLPKDVQRQIVAIKRKHAEWMNVYLSFGYYSEVQDVEVDAMELFLKYQARNLKQWMAWLNDPNQWRHKYIDYTWIKVVSFFSRDIHDPTIYRHYRLLMDDLDYRSTMEKLFIWAASSQDSYVLSLLAPLFVSHHIVHTTAAGKMWMVNLLNTDDLCYAAIFYTNNLIRANDERTKAELPELAILFRLMIKLNNYDIVILQRLFQMQCMSNNKLAKSYQLDIFNPEYIKRVSNDVRRHVILGSHMLQEKGTNCILNKCFVDGCKSNAQTLFSRSLKGIWDNVAGLQLAVNTKEFDRNVEMFTKCEMSIRVMAQHVQHVHASFVQPHISDNKKTKNPFNANSRQCRQNGIEIRNDGEKNDDRNVEETD